jgi:hypothetical protein
MRTVTNVGSKYGDCSSLVVSDCMSDAQLMALGYRYSIWTDVVPLTLQSEWPVG